MSINTPTGWDEELKSRLKWLTPEQRDELLEILKQDKQEREKSNSARLYRETKFKDLEDYEREILEDLKKNHVKVEKNKEILWYKWNIVHIDLPAVWDFKWFKFEYFISNKDIRKESFEKNPEFEKKSCSMEEIWALLKAFNEYMEECGIDTDGFTDYEHRLKYRKTNRSKCVVWDFLRLIMVGVDWYNWLKEKNVWGKNGSRAIWDFNSTDWFCYFGWLPNNYVDAKLLLKLSD